jgi:hypothetical protein
MMGSAAAGVVDEEEFDLEGDDSVGDADRDQRSGATSNLVATGRTGLTPQQLSCLGARPVLAPNALVPPQVVSQTAQRRRRLDELLTESVESERQRRRVLHDGRAEQQSFMEALMVMDQRAREQDLEYRRERDAREAERSARQEATDKLLFALLAKILDK